MLYSVEQLPRCDLLRLSPRLGDSSCLCDEIPALCLPRRLDEATRREGSFTLGESNTPRKTLALRRKGSWRSAKATRREGLWRQADRALWRSAKATRRERLWRQADRALWRSAKATRRERLTICREALSPASPNAREYSRRGVSLSRRVAFAERHRTLSAWRQSLSRRVAFAERQRTLAACCFDPARMASWRIVKVSRGVLLSPERQRALSAWRQGLSRRVAFAERQRTLAACCFDPGRMASRRIVKLFRGVLLSPSVNSEFTRSLTLNLPTFHVYLILPWAVKWPLQKKICILI